MTTGPALLFCPADRPDRFAKALAAADGVILDLEDGVGVGRKQEARASLAAAAAELPADRTIVRINVPESDEGQADLAVVRSSPLDTVMLPKADDPDVVESLAPLKVVALCETARGVLAAREIAEARNCVALMWGGEDLVADIGGRRSRRADGGYLPVVTHARATILLASAAARVLAWDGVYLAIDDLAGLAAETDDAVAMGFAAKVAVHPSQVPVIRAAFSADAEAVAWARDLLEAAEQAGAGVFRFRGQMVDGPLIAQARAIVAAAGTQADQAR
ncbi:MAG: CoA ester lyase [Streptosporangiales bacterium]|nr:CoA ester lyase [Streptosporangiales bacterium]